MKVDSVNFWLCTKDTFDIRGSVAESRSLSFYGSFLDAEVVLALSTIGRHPSGDVTELDQMLTNVFEGLNLENGDVMVILSAREPVTVRNLKVVNESVLVVAQMPAELLEQFANQLRVTFTLSEYGVYSKVFHPNNRKQLIFRCSIRFLPLTDLDLLTVIRNKLWHLTGALSMIGALRGEILNNFPNQAENRLRPAPLNEVQTLKREMGHVQGDCKDDNGEDCTICRTSMVITELPCGHQFHTSCAEEWLLGVSNSCPLCRKRIDSKDTNESPGTGEVETLGARVEAEVFSDEAVNETVHNDTTGSEGII
jgi:RING finger family protein